MTCFDKSNIKTILWLGLFCGGLITQVEANETPYVGTIYPHVVNSNSVTVSFEPSSEIPESVAVVLQGEEAWAAWEVRHKERMDKWRKELAANRDVQPRPRPPTPESTIYDSAKWVPFQTNLLVDLGPGAGRRQILFGYKFKGQPFDGHWSGSTITIQDTPPVIVLTNPKPGITSRPMIQLQGYTTTDWGKPMTYQIFDEHGSNTATGQGLVINRVLLSRAPRKIPGKAKTLFIWLAKSLRPVATM